MKIAGVQMNVSLMAKEENLNRIIERMKETAAEGAALSVFPECAVTGYCFESLEEAIPYAETIPGPTTKRLQEICRKLNHSVVVGMLELAEQSVYNAAVLITPEGVLGSYRKVHLPFLGVDRFATPGDRAFEVHAHPEANIGLNICYDSAFPESSRAMTLQGADLIVLPTNWPSGAECVAEHAINIRAMENGIYYCAINRVGMERGFQFIGKSSICAPTGETLACASGTEEEVLYAMIDPAIARNKRVDRVPEKHVIDRLADRRPEMYGKIVEPHGLQPPNRS
ncbi:MAG: carbon-nitrogen hydrolase family protein [Planctomycetes bacterium]|nr:carbon-nitrogen hydrolase family protein [Planctomycetota bacterium]MCH9723412.1 carbon-nitrogen hydrolase family protein [Planctomycetota bacterium]MCH9775142.1 carbon-nitrogen hydrolase family protein [Planctomycetota bacterium]MCH9793453.1 carbon-nitrogen hydrolase family protein [Planctomycetota bacterium]